MGGKFWKELVCVWILAAIVCISIFPCYAQGVTGLQLSTEETIQSGKNFYVNIDCEMSDMSVVVLSLTYDSDLLEFKDAVLQNKMEGDEFRSNWQEGSILLAVFNDDVMDGKKTLRLGFAPLTKAAAVYHFQAICCDGCTLQGKPIEQGVDCTMTMTINESGTSVETSHSQLSNRKNSDVSSRVSLPSTRVSKANPTNRSRFNTASKAADRSDDEESDVAFSEQETTELVSAIDISSSEQTGGNTARYKEKVQQDFFCILLGIGIGALVAYLVYHQRQKNKHHQ